MTRLVRWQTLLAALGILTVGGLLVQFSLTRQVAIVPVRGGTYVEGMVGTPQYLNPLLATTDADQGIVSLIFEGLSTLQADGSVTPALAQEWAVSAGGTVYTCTLRSDARWHDGEPVTTEDVSFTLHLISSPDLPDPNHLAELWSRVQTTVLDERRLRFMLERPYAPFLSYTTLPILPAHLLRDVSPADLPLSTYNLNPIGTGPFRFVRLQEAEDGTLTLDMEANPLYYRQTPPIYLEGVQVRFYRDEGALVEALRQGEVDGAFGLSAESLASLSDQTDLVAYRTYLQAYTILFLNTKSPLLADLRLRQAIAMGLDQPTLIKETGGEVFPANGPISPISWAYKPDLAPLPYDPDKAQALLEQAGWRDLNGDGTRERDVRQLELTLLTRDMPAERILLARGIERELAPLGIAINVVVKENPDEFSELVANRQFDLLLSGWRQLGRDPDEFALWHSSQIGPGGLNLSSFQNEEIDQLLEQGRTVLDRDLRTQIYWQFQELFAQEVPAIPLYYPVYTYVLRSRIHGVELAPLNDLGDRFHNVTAWYIKTQKVILGQSQPAPRY
jgi:peptide/nickel transport system substrate-binding protein